MLPFPLDDALILTFRPVASAVEFAKSSYKTEDKTLKATDIPAEKIMGDTLSYATELERIV